MTIYATHSTFQISANKFYKVVMKKEYTHKPKIFSSLGEGIEGAVETYNYAGYYLQDIKEI